MNLDIARKKMVQEQIVARGISDRRVLDAMLKIPRHIFVQEAMAAQAYSDSALPIGEKQTISQPYMVALMTEILGLSGNEKVLEIGTVMLEQLGLHVITARDGQEALEKFSANGKISVVILDLTIPGGSGALKTIARLKQVDPAVKAILFSGYATDPAILQYQEMGFAGVITKPFRLEELASVIHRVRGGA